MLPLLGDGVGWCLCAWVLGLGLVRPAAESTAGVLSGVAGLCDGRGGCVPEGRDNVCLFFPCHTPVTIAVGMLRKSVSTWSAFQLCTGQRAGSWWSLGLKALSHQRSVEGALS